MSVLPTDSKRAAALAYAEHGWAVIPCGNDKRPLVKWKAYQTERPSLDQVREWWTTYPDANIAVLTGRISGISVLDVDDKPWENKHGKDTLFALITKHGAVPTTPTQRTWSGGMQFLFAYAPAAAQGANCYGADLDGRNDGGYVLVPPSTIEDGARDGSYTWVHDPLVTPLADMPAWLLAQVANTNGTMRRLTPAPASAAVQALKTGKGRNNALTSLAGSMRRRGMSPEAIYAGIAAENEQSPDPLPDEEVQTIARSVGRYEPADDTDAPGNAADGVRTAALADSEPENVAWLWPRYIPAGMLTLFAGDPEQGKSTIMFDFAARITTGAPWPDGARGGEPADVALLASEDSVTHTVVPRLLAAGADLGRVRQIRSVVVQGKDQHFSLARDLDALDAEYGRRPFTALIVDPINAYLPSVDTYRDNEVRAVLTPLTDWAERRGVAVVAIIHMGKNADRNALQRILGSVAFGAASRASYLACRDAAAEGRRLFLCSKMSVAVTPPGLAFRFEPRAVIGKAGNRVETVGVAWEPGTVKETAEEALRALVKTGPQQRQEATKVIRAVLADGPIEAAEATTQIRAAGVSMGTLNRAKLDLGVRSVRVGGVGDEGRWFWVPLEWTPDELAQWKTKAFAEVLAAKIRA